MQGPFTQAYQPLGTLLIDMDHGDEATGYRRALDLTEGTAEVAYTVDGVRHAHPGSVPGLGHHGPGEMPGVL